MVDKVAVSVGCNRQGSRCIRVLKRGNHVSGKYVGGLVTVCGQCARADKVTLSYYNVRIVCELEARVSSARYRKTVVV